jgi:large subunit ribosomal protein L31
MKLNIHPKIYDVTFLFNNGKELKVKSTLGKKGEQVIINAGDWAPENHSAWTKSQSTSVKSTTNISKFKDKFGDDLFGV